jgi:hypothetical protein
MLVGRQRGIETTTNCPTNPAIRPTDANQPPTKGKPTSTNGGTVPGSGAQSGSIYSNLTSKPTCNQSKAQCLFLSFSFYLAPARDAAERLRMLFSQ